jgi:hypothetical protein
MTLSLPEWLTRSTAWPPAWLHPWHVALGAALLCVLGFVVARVQFNRAREDWANAFFYSPSSKTRQRQRRQKWQDRMWALLVLGIAAGGMAAYLYARTPR